MDATWVSLLPPLLVIVSIFITRQLNFSLFFGVCSAAMIAAHSNIIVAAKLCLERGIGHFSDIDNIYLYSLLVIISSLIVLLTATGSAAGCAQLISKRIRSKRSAEMSSVLLAFLLSIDDYLSILTVGFVMTPIADRLAVARTKLAYIVHALAGPLVIIMPISTWAAAILVQCDNAGIGTHATSKIIADPFFVYLQTIPFIFYSLLLVTSVIWVVCRRISFGLIYQDESLAKPIIYHEGSKMQQVAHSHSLIELLMPIGLLVSGVFFGILYAGDFYLFGGKNSLIDAFRSNNQTFLVFFIAGLVSFVSSVLLLLWKRMIIVRQLPVIVYEGFVLMQSSIIMVALASILGSFLRLDLNTGSYVASMLLGTAPLFLIPVMVFIVSFLITLATGSAWGTFSLLIPIVVQMIVVLLRVDTPISIDQIPLLFPTLGALLSGAACGNHVAPFAETTIMTATSTGIQPLEHARTQFPYAVPVIIGASSSFTVSGLLYQSGIYINVCISLGVGMGIMGILFLLADKISK